MANVRNAIAFSDAELRDYFETSLTITMATTNHDGYPHLVPMWYAMLDGLVHMHTYRSSQKVRNIERDPRGALLLEDGIKYEKLRGVYVRGRFTLADNRDLRLRLGLAIAVKYQGLSHAQAGDAEEAILAYTAKRVVMVFHPEKTSSWDHSKI